VTVRVVLPGALRELAGGAHRVDLDLPAGASLADALQALGSAYPALQGRIFDETGAVRRHVNVYVDGDDMRGGAGLDTVVKDGSVVDVLPSIAGG
jgi:molybdopterin synthase sulfur carrier subunit